MNSIEETNKEHWNEFYAHNGKCRTSSSPFCDWIFENYCRDYMKILEFGCGQGGDAKKLATPYNIVHAIDISEEAIKIAKQNTGNPHNVFWECADIMTYPFQFKYDMVYSRFTMHCLDIKNQMLFLQKAGDLLVENGLLCIEVRSTKDKLFGKGKPAGHNAWINGHFRCFMDLDILLAKLADMEYWNTLFVQESDGWSQFEGDSPVLIRLVAKRGAI